ncbi:glutathione S-transferase family protein [Lutibaculum baratangense]|uniref:Glutathione S-transferase, omega n=1 Tax=Lutibaculum baratangense AMV1 TaxID=631454 RepID=V4T9E6_9HYPH|nr:glutathione S-transferase family protein [Lutibaculum baratangense]ESR23153.1 Glutathione S-transferase, omega [Lutibaculum baratangense AMV1]
MGLLVDGNWQDKWYDTDKTGGRFKREDSVFRNWVTADGSAGPSGTDGFAAEPGRYHLYVSYACPWAHRTLIVRKLKGLENVVSFSPVDWLMLDEGWVFDDEHPDPLFGARRLYEIYLRAKPDYTGRVTVPTLWDKKRGTIVSNESSEIIRMLNTAFDAFAENPALDLYPEHLRGRIDEVNERVYHSVNNGVYKAGFATEQEAYEEAFADLFATLEDLDRLLGQSRYLAGEQLTEADWRLFTTLVRFDPVYHGHFKCNLKRIADYPNLSGYLRELYQVPGIEETVRFDHIKGHYYASHRTINPTGIVPVGPQIDLHEPHGRERLKAA